MKRYHIQRSFSMEYSQHEYFARILDYKKVFFVSVFNGTGIKMQDVF
jgi:hypothetical protein